MLKRIYGKRLEKFALGGASNIHSSLSVIRRSKSSDIDSRAM
jgi:hypothetical protein